MTDIKVLAREVEECEKENQKYVDACPYRQHFHIMPPVGFLNDPNGLCFYRGEYHIYYQYAPFNPLGGLKFWGHYSTPDFINWKKHPVFLCPDTAYDKDGVYSGCVFEENGNLHFFYTGNVRHKGNYDYICTGREQNTIHVISRDAIHAGHKERILSSNDYPKNLSNHVRNPKVWKENDGNYMILGARTLNTEGEAIIYTSHNLSSWKYLNTLKMPHSFGYMWECPDIYNLNKKTVFAFCPQGIKEKGFEFNNIYQSGYCFIEGDFKNNYSLSGFTEFDHGFDFYAPQTFTDQYKRQIMIALMFVPDSPFENPTIENGWQHCLTVPRELYISNGVIYQKPIKEIENLRQNKKSFIINNNTKIVPESKAFDAVIKFNDKCKQLKLNIRNDISLILEDEIITLKLGKSGYGRKERHYTCDSISSIRILNDISSIEIFIDGQSFSSRVYDDCKNLQLHFEICDVNCEMELYSLKQFSTLI